MIIEYDETYASVKLYHSVYDTKPFKVIGIEDLVSLWLMQEEKESEEEECVSK